MKKDQDCERCKTVRLLPENAEAWELIMKIAPGVLSGFGGVDYSAIKFVFDQHNLSRDLAQETFEKVMVFVDEMLDHIDKKSRE